MSMMVHLSILVLVMKESSPRALEVYVELGPAIGLENGADADTRLEVEVGGDVALTESLELYGEVEMRTGPLNDYGTKIGLQYNF